MVELRIVAFEPIMDTPGWAPELTDAPSNDTVDPALALIPNVSAPASTLRLADSSVQVSGAVPGLTVALSPGPRLAANAKGVSAHSATSVGERFIRMNVKRHPDISATPVDFIEFFQHGFCCTPDYRAALK
ncbi:hypothetical protein NJ69_00780 [Pseudomonas parafulva]|nr:hypothetical protein NJ69_00780 [Pseudomonas parafulva]